MTFHTLNRYAVVCLGAGALMLACGSDTPPAPPKAIGQAGAPQPAVQPAAPAAAPATAPAPTTAPTAVTEPAPSEYTYDLSVRDPFKPMRIEKAEDGLVDCGPLCQYDLGQFRVTGIIWGISQPAAMVQAPNGNPYIVKVGTPIGRNNGKVVSISKDRIAVLEKYVNYRGEVVTNRVDIELPDQGGRK